MRISDWSSDVCSSDLREFLLSAPLSQETWRPWSLTPSTTINAASSLIVPVVTLYLVSAMPQEERAWLPAIMLGAIFLSMLVGLLQFSGFMIDNPFINDTKIGRASCRERVCQYV